MTCRCPHNRCDGNLTVRGDYAICPKCLRLVGMKWVLMELERLREENERLRELVREAPSHLMEPNVMMRTSWRERARAALEPKP